ncbi:hypothetical protein CKO44_03860 [Rubrivivax gelatinosus]|uniref:DUF2188 domain-containing protein n=1 Tax=Rubrivivax gelatinosus TaxID=28068 RepID=A0ABS1DNS2_RUBGE|nr:hypothetical protein [Rubrivivax gelatinosus]MBK1612599.1 hypothetical protein [Rubrivivax gelatinosus]MBK1711652.1 hypothetical protein [Rubrivivax gelatinosus]
MKPQVQTPTRFVPAAIEDEASLDATPPGDGELVQRPDGWYWLADAGRQQFGPYASEDEALAAMEAASDGEIEPCETLFEAEQEIGIADWLDPDTGEPAEGVHTRLEDH